MSRPEALIWLLVVIVFSFGLGMIVGADLSRGLAIRTAVKPEAQLHRQRLRALTWDLSLLLRTIRRLFDWRAQVQRARQDIDWERRLADFRPIWEQVNSDADGARR